MKSYNKFNQFYVDEFNNYYKEAKDKNNKNMVTIYKKLITSIQKYPLPIISSSQALSLEGIGEKCIKTFELIINKYKIKIRNENIDYVSLAKDLDLAYDLKERRRQERSKSKEKNNFDSSKRKKLPNIDQSSSLWSSIISLYIVYFQNDYDMTICYEDMLAMTNTLKEQLTKIILIQNCDWNDVSQLKTYCMIDNYDRKAKKVQLNDFLIKFAKIELEKIGIILEKDLNNQSIRFTLLKENHVNQLDYCSVNRNFAHDFSEIKEENSIVFSSNKKSKKDRLSTLSTLSITQSYKNLIETYKNNPHIILFIDNREGRQNKETGLFYQKIKEEGINCEEKTLSVGDFLWIYRDPSNLIEYVLEYIIERKTIDDLAKSIIDGRYDEQKYRLKNCGVKNIYYLFEGISLSTNNFSIQKSSIQTAIFNTLNIHDINIIKTTNIKDSIIAIKKLHELISKVQFDFCELQTFSDFSKKNFKNKNTSVEKIFSKQLRCFDKCGRESVILINSVFKTPLMLYSCINKLDKEDQINLIAASRYVLKENLPLTEENILYYSRKEIFNIKVKNDRECKSISKKLNEVIIDFYI